MFKEGEVADPQAEACDQPVLFSQHGNTAFHHNLVTHEIIGLVRKWKRSP